VTGARLALASTGMDRRPRADHDDRALRLRLDVRLDRQPITGRLRTEGGAEESFVGWLGFADALRRLRDRAAAAPDRPDDGSGDA
jgi:hypothetical protein